LIRLTFNKSDERMVAALRAKGPQLRAQLQMTMDELMTDLLARVQQKLSGEVLKTHRGGGGLLGSARKIPTQTTGSTITGAVQAGGGLFWWAVVHEEGGKKRYDIFPGIVTGKSDKRALAFFPAGSEGASFGTTRMTSIRFATGKRRGQLKPKKYGTFAEAGGIVVRHVSHPPLPKRSFMATSLQEMTGEIIQRIYSAAAKALE
jgi:hypothetical protein